MNSEMIDLQFQVLTYTYPVANALILGMCLWGLARSQLKGAFLVISLATACWLIPQTFLAIAQVKADFGVTLLAQPWARLSSQVAMVSTWVAVLLHLLGVLLLVRGAIRLSRDASR